MQPSIPLDQRASGPSTATPGEVRSDVAQYVDAWSSLFVRETQIAQHSLVRLGLACLIVPAIVLTLGVALDAFIAALVNRWLQDWTAAVAIALLFDCAALYALVRLMRGWWHALSLPRSRQALTRLLGTLT